jgi:hypothetical protein
MCYKALDLLPLLITIELYVFQQWGFPFTRLNNSGILHRSWAVFVWVAE